MSFKTCPSCGAEVPASAARCKNCFHDFNAPPPKRSNALIVVLVTLAAMVCAGAATMYWVVHEQAVKRNVVIDQETQSVVWTKTSSQGMETDRLDFADIKEIELITGGKKAVWEVYAITHDGDRRLLNAHNENSLQGYAIHVAEVMKKPLVEIREKQEYLEEDVEDRAGKDRAGG